MKCTIWCAPIPKRNVAISYHSNKDYIGPDIDFGFRLTSQSDENLTSICPITAYLILNTNFKHETKHETKLENESIESQICFSNFQLFKGIPERRATFHIHPKSSEVDSGFSVNQNSPFAKLGGVSHRKDFFKYLVEYIRSAYPNLVIEGTDEFELKKKDIADDDKRIEELKKIIGDCFNSAPTTNS